MSKVLLSEKEIEEIEKYCKGCKYFDPLLPIGDICTILSWFDNADLEGRNIKYVKACPCNQKCLVKAACTEEKCPIWTKHVKKMIAQRNSDAHVKKLHTVKGNE